MPMIRARTKRGAPSSLKKFVGSAKRRRVSTVSKIRYQRPSARNQKKQIMSNAKKISAVARIVYSHRVFCDWQYKQSLFADVNSAGGGSTTWGIWPLTNFPDWTGVMRQDVNTDESSSTYLARLQQNLRYSLNASNWAQFNVFIVSLRKDSAAYDPVELLSTGTPPVLNEDYIEGPGGLNIRLNSARYKVHYARYLTLTENTLGQNARPNAPAGNPSTTWAKGQFTMPVKSAYRSAAGTNAPWGTITYKNQPYYQRYFLMCFIVQTNIGGLLPDTCATFELDQLAVTINNG